MNDNDFRTYWALITELNDCVEEALFLMKNASYKEECRLSSDCYVMSLTRNANLLKRQISNAVQEQFKAKKLCDTQR